MMIAADLKPIYYQALLDKNTEYDGLFCVGVTTTGIFCRPSCPARKPKFEHCEFFEHAQGALLAGFRPCKRCKPLSHPDQVSDTVKTLVDAIEKQPEKRWSATDFNALSTNAATARRQFKKRFGMTFVEYARARRMGLALQHIKAGRMVIDAQLATGYESSSGFADAFSNIMGACPTQANTENLLKAAWLDTPLGPMIAIASDTALYLLEFVDRRALEREIQVLREKTQSAIIPGKTAPIACIEKELETYFKQGRVDFKTPLSLLGSDFQKAVWQALMAILPGQTCSYAQIANTIERPLAYRAVARANGANQLAIIVPCHRVINSNGELGGYGGGLSRKAWLIHHEKGEK